MTYAEDPVIAVRSLRLQTTLNKVNQYYERNIPDAEQWLEITETSIDTTVGVISGMHNGVFGLRKGNWHSGGVRYNCLCICDLTKRPSAFPGKVF